MRVLAIILALTFAVPARAAETLTRAEMAALSKGEPVVRVMRDAQSKSVASGQAFSAIDIPTPPEAVFAALTDCARVTRYVKNLVSCKILKHDPMGAWDIRETIMSLSMALPNFRAVARLDYVRPKQIKFQQTEGNFDYAQGQWDLAPFREGKATRVFYRVRAGTSFPVPEFVIQNLIESDLPETLKALRAEAVRGHSAAKR